ncbi:hypothetical protein [Aeromonas veronii]|uniref:hypothetical protein n=1 Tax=Aeromonas veronii TaxID=654 RepID=UPI0018F1CC3E|nr:hypothetical protein [Aeromonas veronii]MBJ7590169.1 hypothetical protein [Aeromonas veronii]
MANVTETPSYDAGIYQIETTDPVLGGPNGIANAQAKGLANRTAFLKQQIDQLNSGQLTPAWIASQDYVQEQLQKLDAKQSVRAATTANITLSGAQTIDGVTLMVGARVLVKDQTAAAQNGIYLVAAQSWSRATDADNGTKLSSGARVAVEEGTVNAGKVWHLATTGSITVGTTLLQFNDEHPAATQQLPGVLRFATQAEAASGTLDNVAVSPKDVNKVISSRYLASGSPLPVVNIGPIWHDDYADWMTWQTFNQNGASYTGYASRLIGSLLLDTQPTPRAGYIKSGVQNLSRVTYAALRAWAQHNGLMVAPGVWTAGAIQCADNADGTTFRIYDVRGEFLRAFDDGRGVDAGRAPLSNQADSIQHHSHSLPTSTSNSSSSSGIWGVHDQYWGQYDTFNEQPANGHFAGTSSWFGQVPGMARGNFQPETRPRNTALPAAIKY